MTCVTRIRTLLPHLTGAVLCLVLSACIPVRSTFYRPNVQSVGQVTNYSCYKAGGAPNALLFTRNGVQFVVSIINEQPPVDNILNATVKLRVPLNKSVQMNLSEVKVINEKGETIGQYSSVSVLHFGSKNAKSKRVVLPVSTSSLPGNIFPDSKYDALYNVWINVEAPLPKSLFVEIPSMHIGGSEYGEFLIKFEEVHETHIQPLNGC